MSTREREGASLARKRDIRAETAQRREEEEMRLRGTEDPDRQATTVETETVEEGEETTPGTEEATLQETADTEREDHHHKVTAAGTTDVLQEHMTEMKGTKDHTHQNTDKDKDLDRQFIQETEKENKESKATEMKADTKVEAEETNETTAKTDTPRAPFVAQTTHKSGQSNDQLTQRRSFRKTQKKSKPATKDPRAMRDKPPTEEPKTTSRALMETDKMQRNLDTMTKPSNENDFSILCYFLN
jgi:hypothetical protein